jgi:hypothetical protein
MSFRIKRLIDNQRSLEPEVVRAIMSLAHAISFTETIFVSAAGDNSDGSSWNRAYTSLTTALDWIEANQATGEVHCVMLGEGIWDMNLTGVPIYTASIALYGINSGDVEIINNHATATGVLQFTGWCSINDVQIGCGTGEIGITLNGINAYGCRLNNIVFDCTLLAGAADAIQLTGGASYCIIDNIIIVGEVTNTTGIRLDTANHNIIQNVKVMTALVGIHLDNATDDSNIFKDFYLHTCTTGILVDAGAADNHFNTILFYGNTTRINDNGTTNLFNNILLSTNIVSVSPDDLTGILIVGGVGANVYSAAAVQIRAASATPFKIIGIGYECAVAEKTGIRLYSDGGTNTILDITVETEAGLYKSELLDPIFVNQGLAIHGRVKSEAGGNNCIIWLLIQII